MPTTGAGLGAPSPPEPERMRRVAAVLVAALTMVWLAAAPASARLAVGEVGVFGCLLDVDHDSAVCTVVVKPGLMGFGVSVWAGVGYGSVSCPQSGYAQSFGGGYGDDYETFTSTADVCHLEVHGLDGVVSADLYPAS
jgi:hypothetical protein